MITYPTNRLLAVFDHHSQADGAAEQLLAEGFPEKEINLIFGPHGLSQLRRLGPSRGPLAGFIRMFQFMTMDQMPDFVTYEAAVADGRTVLAVRLLGGARIAQGRHLVAEAGGHFINYYGRFATEEMTRWRGPQPRTS